MTQPALPSPTLKQRVYTLPLPTQLNALYGVRRDGKRYKVAEGHEWEQNAAMSLLAQGWEKPDWECWALAVRVYFRDWRPDLDGVFKQVCDLLKKMVGSDDRYLVSIMAERLIDRTNPRIEVSVWEHYTRRPGKRKK